MSRSPAVKPQPGCTQIWVEELEERQVFSVGGLGGLPLAGPVAEAVTGLVEAPAVLQTVTESGPQIELATNVLGVNAAVTLDATPTVAGAGLPALGTVVTVQADPIAALGVSAGMGAGGAGATQDPGLTVSLGAGSLLDVQVSLGATAPGQVGNPGGGGMTIIGVDTPVVEMGADVGDVTLPGPVGTTSPGQSPPGPGTPGGSATGGETGGVTTPGTPDTGSAGATPGAGGAGATPGTFFPGNESAGSLTIPTGFFQTTILLPATALPASEQAGLAVDLPMMTLGTVTVPAGEAATFPPTALNPDALDQVFRNGDFLVPGDAGGPGLQQAGVADEAAFALEGLGPILDEAEGAVATFTSWLARLGPLPWVLMGLTLALAAAELARQRQRRRDRALMTNEML